MPNRFAAIMIFTDGSTVTEVIDRPSIREATEYFCRVWGENSVHSVMAVPYFAQPGGAS